MTRRKKLIYGGLALFSLLLFSQCRRSARRDPARRAADLEQEAAAYQPTALEVPLTADFTKAANQRVQSDNYAKELGRIERELKALRALR